MPPKANKSKYLAKAREVLTEKRTILASETATDDLWTELQAAHQRIDELETKLGEKDKLVQKLSTDLEKSNQKLFQYEDKITFLELKQEKTYHELRMQRQTTKRGQVKVANLEKQVQILEMAEAQATSQFLTGSRQSKQALDSLMTVNEGLRSELSKSMARWTAQIGKVQTQLDASHSNINALRQEASALRKMVVRYKDTKERAIAAVKEKIMQKKSVHHLMEKGVFTEETRNVVRLLVKAGCSRNYINEVISTVLNSTGITVVGNIS